MSHAEVLREMIEVALANAEHEDTNAAMEAYSGWGEEAEQAFTRKAEEYRLQAAALRAGAEALQREEWRPIETAPGSIFILGFHAERKCTYRLRREGQTLCNSPLFVDSWPIDNFTHWRPMPAPPKEAV